MGTVMQDLNHPVFRVGGEWILLVTLVAVIAILAGGIALAVRHVARNPPDLSLPVPAEHSSP